MSKNIILTVINSQNLINFDLEYVKSKVDLACQLCVRESKESAPLKELETVETVSYTHLTLPTICSV